MYTPENSNSVQDVEFVYKVKITDCKDKTSTKEDLANFLRSTKTLSYSEEVIEGAVKTENALVQCWTHKKPSSKAVLWVLGRNDCFMHPHVGKDLFTDKGYDLYVLNYSADGMCRQRGWVVSQECCTSLFGDELLILVFFLDGLNRNHSHQFFLFFA